MEYNLESLPSSDIQYITLELAKSNNHSVIITLTNGEQLFGDLFPEFRFFDKTPDEEEWGLVEKDGDVLIVSENCNDCELCIMNCPNEAISKVD